MSENQIQILLATYNGGRFLGEQLDSLFNQTNQNWRLIIRDDSSTDNTIDIINEYRDKYPGKISLLHDADNTGPHSKNLNFHKNFGRLLENATAKYVMLCDQDDIWHSNKIERSLAEIKKMEAQYGDNKPLLVYSNSTVADINGKIKHHSHHVRERHGEWSYHRALRGEGALGMTMLMNNHLVTNSVNASERLGHDNWVLRVAVLIGKINYIDTPLVDHRIHGSNVSGIGPNMKFPTYNWAERIKDNFKNGIDDFYTKKKERFTNPLIVESKIAETLLERFGDQVSPADKKLLQVCVNLPSMPALEKRMALVQYRLLSKDPLSKLAAMAFS